MSINILHQCGHNASWNRQAFNEGNGSGLIFSPVHEKIQQIENYPSDIKSKSIFDPQFYLPNSQKAKLKEYPFFPEVIANGFTTANFSVVAIDAARQCIQFQQEQNFERIIIPSRFVDQMTSNYFEAQDVYSVIPFLKAIAETGKNNKRVYITLAVTSHMLADEKFKENALNWITSYPEIDGVYLIFSHERPTKQICDSNVIYSNLEFIRAIKGAGLNVLVGYCNTESLLYSMIDDIEITFGAYENTRIFSMDKFVISEEDQRGPRPRIYMAGLFNWIQLEQAREIRSDAPHVWQQIYEPTEQSEEALNSNSPWHFGKSHLYHHHFNNLNSETLRLSGMNTIDRHAYLRSRLRRANEFYEAIDRAPIDLEIHGSGKHITPWLDAINKFYRKNL